MRPRRNFNISISTKICSRYGALKNRSGGFPQRIPCLSLVDTEAREREYGRPWAWIWPLVSVNMDTHKREYEAVRLEAEPGNDQGVQAHVAMSGTDSCAE